MLKDSERLGDSGVPRVVDALERNYVVKIESTAKAQERTVGFAQIRVASNVSGETWSYRKGNSDWMESHWRFAQLIWYWDLFTHVLGSYRWRSRSDAVRRSSQWKGAPPKHAKPQPSGPFHSATPAIVKRDNQQRTNSGEGDRDISFLDSNFRADRRYLSPCWRLSIGLDGLRERASPTEMANGDARYLVQNLAAWWWLEDSVRDA